jgi:hypothetical protein
MPAVNVSAEKKERIEAVARAMVSGLAPSGSNSQPTFDAATVAQRAGELVDALDAAYTVPQ